MRAAGNRSDDTPALRISSSVRECPIGWQIVPYFQVPQSVPRPDWTVAAHRTPLGIAAGGSFVALDGNEKEKLESFRAKLIEVVSAEFLITRNPCSEGDIDFQDSLLKSKYFL
jgi:hypothetical protein